jgi:hypothetical protein
VGKSICFGYLAFDMPVPVAYNWAGLSCLEVRALAEKERPVVTGEGQKPDVEQIKRHLEMLDRRLDNIDSVVNAVVERVMKQPMVINITCPHCGKSIEIALIGSHKPTA